MNRGRDSLDIEGESSAVTSSVARRGSETENTNETTEISDILAEIVKLLSKALILALRLSGQMVCATISPSNSEARLLTEEGQRSTDPSNGETAPEEAEENEAPSEQLVEAADER